MISLDTALHILENISNRDNRGTPFQPSQELPHHILVLLKTEVHQVEVLLYTSRLFEVPSVCLPVDQSQAIVAVPSLDIQNLFVFLKLLATFLQDIQILFVFLVS